MSTLVAIVFKDEASAFKMREKLVSMQASYLIELEDAVVVTKAADGKVKLHQAVNVTAASALGGTFWGMLVGLLFLNPLLGAVVGAGSGAVVGALSDIGIKDDFMRDLSGSLQQGGSVLFFLARTITLDKVIEGLQGFEGTVLQTSLNKADEEHLRQVLSSPAVQAELTPPTPTDTHNDDGTFTA